MTNRPYLTASLPGTGGRFDPCPDDFEVEEIPLYEPCGEGEHLYVRIEKVGLATRDVVRRAVALFGVAEADVGYAGLKDKHARAIQTLSVRGITEADARRIEGDGVAVRSAIRHRNKLRVGHLAGNRFRAVIRGAGAAADRARAILEALASAGLPNFYGEQRFGVAGENPRAARDLLRRGPRAAGSRWKAKLLASALQSDLFNRYLAARMERGAHGAVRAGDVLTRVDSGGIFVCREPKVDQARHDRFEVSITGPIFGPEMRRAEGEPAAWEEAVLAEAGLGIEDFGRMGKIASGTRRPLRVPVREASAEREGDDLIVRFTLPPGSYGTVLLGEVVKA